MTVFACPAAQLRDGASLNCAGRSKSHNAFSRSNAMTSVPHSKEQLVIGLRSSDDQEKNPKSASPQHKQHDVHIYNCVPCLYCLQLSDAVMKKKLAHDVFQSPCFP